MVAQEALAAIKTNSRPGIWVQVEPALGLATGLGGGIAQSFALGTPLTHGLLFGGLFGLAFGTLFRRRATSAGAGLIWGMAAAFLLWLVIPAGLQPLFGHGRLMAALNDVRSQFPLLVAYLLCLGMPVGLALGIRGGLRSNVA